MSGIYLMITEFLKIGLFGFGGGIAILPLIYQSVEKIGGMTPEDFSNLVGISQVTPGPVAVNAATFVGFHEGGFLGAALATIAVSLPGFILVIIAVHFLEKFKESKVLKGLFSGIRPATVGLIFTAMLMVASGTLYMNGTWTEIFKSLPDSIHLLPCGIFLVTILLSGKFKLSPILIIIIMGVSGALMYGYIL